MAELSTWLMVFLRASGMLALFPVFSARNIPVMLRVALGALMAFLIAPIAGGPAELPTDSFGLIGLMSAELGVGLLMGFVARMIFYTVELAGSLIGMNMGLFLPSGIDPMMEGQSPAPAAILNYLAAILWLTMDLHHWMLVGFERTYRYLPIGGAGMGEGLALDLLARSGHVFLLALQMAAPIIAVTFIVTLVFSVLGRVVPQMPVFTESFAFRLLSGLVVLGLTLQLLAQHVTNYLRRLPEDILRVAQLLAVG